MAKLQRAKSKPDEEAEDSSAGVQAVDTAVQLLSTLLDMGPPMSLKSIAERAGMAPPKAHRYLVSLCRNGMAERDAASGGYRLGPLAVRVGLAALRHLNVVSVAGPTLAVLRDEVGHTAGLAVWGTAGPTFVRLEETNDALIISGRPGSVLPVLSSAIGKVFGAYLSPALVEPFIRAELKPGVTRKGIQEMFASVRKHGLANVHGEVNPGLHAIGAPIFDHTQSIIGVLAVMGSPSRIDIRLDGPVAAALQSRAADISRRMGAA